MMGHYGLGGAGGGGRLGLNNEKNYKKPVQVGKDKDWKTVSAGGTHTVALKNDGSLWTWGLNDFGQIGNGETEFGKGVLIPTRIGIDNNWVSIYTGVYHIFAIKNDGSLWAMGANNGNLGDGTFNNIYTPKQIGEDYDWLSVSEAGGDESFHTIAVKKDGTVWTWGNNGNFQLGHGTPDPFYNKLVPTQVNLPGM